MDMTIAAMSDGERAMLSNLLQRGLASLTQRERTDGAIEAVAQLQSVLRTTPSLETAGQRALISLAFAPRGRTLRGIPRGVMLHLADREHVTNHGGPWVITWRGWTKLWAQGTVTEILRDRYGVVTDGTVADLSSDEKLRSL